MSSTDQSRQHRRHVLRASCIARSVEDGRLVGDQVLDVSYAGVRVASVESARIGERVELSIQLPGSKVWVAARGRVERVVRGVRRTDDVPSLGVRIERMNGFDRLMLTQIARACPDVRGTRGGRRDYAAQIQRLDRPAS